MKKQGIIKSIVMALSMSLTGTAQAQGIVENPVMVHTKAGWVQGKFYKGTLTFLGIPYAKVERFMPPQPVEPWGDELRVCEEWGPQAMQMTPGPLPSEDKMSEKNSCVLNVWTCNKHSRKPVMVWLHGGGFDSGSAMGNPGTALAKKDVVVVSINHRLNILGFLDLSTCSDKYKYSGNVGMLDIVAALEWVRDNILSFGGDPDNITVFGESGGGGKVGTLLCMPQAKGLFHKAIILSGTILNVNTKEMTQQLGEAVLKELNIDKDNVDKILEVPYRELYSAGQRAMAKSIGQRKPGTPMMWGFGPTPDGETLTQQPFQPGFADFASNIPIMIGTTFNELQPMVYGKKINIVDASDTLYAEFGEDTDDYIEAFAEAYPYATPQDYLSIDRLFRPKTLATADYIGKHHEANTYAYIFNWRSPLNGGAVHGHELKFCFNTLDWAKNELPDPTRQDRRLADLISNSLVAFATTGNPNTKGLPKWKPYHPDTGHTMLLDYKCAVYKNHDRRLQGIINKHCFKLLDEFQKKNKK